MPLSVKLVLRRFFMEIRLPSIQASNLQRDKDVYELHLCLSVDLIAIDEKTMRNHFGGNQITRENLIIFDVEMLSQLISWLCVHSENVLVEESSLNWKKKFKGFKIKVKSEVWKVRFFRTNLFNVMMIAIKSS